jgi:hypothetical protein
VARPRSSSGCRRGEDLWRNCEGIGRPSGLRGASSADLKKKQSNSIDVGLASPRDKPRTSREPLSGRSQGAPIPSASGKSENRKEGKTSTWPRLSPERQKDTRRWGRGSARSPRGFYEGNPIDARCRTRTDLSVGRGRGCLMGLRGPAAVTLLIQERGEHLGRNCEGIGVPRGNRGGRVSRVTPNPKPSTVTRGSRDEPEAHCAPLSGRCRGTPVPSASGKRENRDKGKRLPGPDSRRETEGCLTMGEGLRTKSQRLL